MQSDAGGRYIHSVSDLCGADEIEFLLDDIRDLEPASYRPEEIQDFEIAGSQTGGAGALDSPLGTVNSWDSHANYRLRLDASPPVSLFSGVIVYCYHAHFMSPVGFVRLLLVISSVACLACLCSSGTVQVGLFMLPLAGRLRLMMFVTIFSILVTCLLLFLDISHIIYLFPLNWGKLNTWLYISISLIYLVSSSLILHMIFMSEVFSWVPRWTKEHLLITGCIGYMCFLEAFILSILHKCTSKQYEPVAEEPQFTLQGRSVTPPGLDPPSPPVIYYPPAIPSTSRQDPMWPDAQPCSSKSTRSQQPA